MNLKTWLVAATFVAFLPSNAAFAQIAADEQEFQAIAAALKANDAERQAAIDTCIAQGEGAELASLAKLMEVSVENSVRAWCMRSTNGIADGKLTISDFQGIAEGKLSDNARAVLKSPVEGE